MTVDLNTIKALTFDVGGTILTASYHPRGNRGLAQTRRRHRQCILHKQLARMFDPRSSAAASCYGRMQTTYIGCTDDRLNDIPPSIRRR